MYDEEMEGLGQWFVWNQNYYGTLVGNGTGVHGSLGINPAWAKAFQPYGNDLTSTYQTLLDAASAGVCEVDTADNWKEQACSVPLKSSISKLACTNAYQASQKAHDCQDGKIEDSNKCYKVCSLVRGSTPALTLKWKVQKFILFMNVCIGLVAICRISRSCCLIVSVFRDQVKERGVGKTLLTETGIDSSSDESEAEGNEGQTPA